MPCSHGGVGVDRLDHRRQRGVRPGARAWTGRDAQALDARARAAGRRRDRVGRCRGIRGRAGVGVDRRGGAGAVLRTAGRRQGACAGASRRRTMAGCARGQPGTPSRLHRRRGHHRMDRAPNVLPAAGGGGHADRRDRGRGQALSGDRRSRRVQLVDRGDGLTLGGRQSVGRRPTSEGPFTVAPWRSVACCSTSMASW